jgi:hypothetical protein
MKSIRQLAVWKSYFTHYGEREAISIWSHLHSVKVITLQKKQVKRAGSEPPDLKNEHFIS